MQKNARTIPCGAWNSSRLVAVFFFRKVVSSAQIQKVHAGWLWGLFGFAAYTSAGFCIVKITEKKRIARYFGTASKKSRNDGLRCTGNQIVVKYEFASTETFECRLCNRRMQRRGSRQLSVTDTSPYMQYDIELQIKTPCLCCPNCKVNAGDFGNTAF